MGWANCGNDSDGRPIGYAHSATCDEPGCTAKIHRGIAYACGNMHGELDWACEKYFCASHLSKWLLVEGEVQPVCASCYREAKQYACDNPSDAAELVAWFEKDEGPSWRQPVEVEGKEEASDG